MAYSFTNSRGTTYYLHKRESETKSGKSRRIFFFSKEMKDSVDKIPEGYEAGETATGLPVLRKKEEKANK